MTKYTISSTAGACYGVYDGDTPEEAFAAMVTDGGGEIGDPSVGTADDWIIEPAKRWLIEGKGHRDWSVDYVGASCDTAFFSEAEAEAALDDLVRTCGWSRDELRVRAL